MPLQGMTGFCRAEGQLDDARWSWEARSVNGKGLDLKLRLPSGCEQLEPVIREACAARFSRGSLQLALTLRRDDVRAGAAALDIAFIEAVLAAAAPYVERGLAQRPTWDGVLALRGALAAADPSEAPLPEAVTARLLANLAAALDGLAGARKEEGAQIERVLAGLIGQIETLTEAAANQAAAAPAAVRDRLAQRLAGLLEAAPVDPSRLAQEVALLAAKADIQEEIDRLRAHAEQARALLASAGPVGRKLEFLTQELNREANTVCSKASELALTRIGLDLKAAIDQFREQIANVE